jgi:hypothetical protein
MQQGTSTIVRKTLDWKHSRVFMFEFEAVHHSFILAPDWFEYCFVYEKFVACGEF